jgi:predicted nucleic acid-binding protein
MNVVDSCGWLEYIAGGPGAAAFAKPIEDIKNLIVPTICIFEVVRRLIQQDRRDIVPLTIAGMRLGKVIELDESIAVNASELSVRHGLSLADSIIYATAQMNDATLWTQDSHFEGIDGVKYVEKK